jgi:uncharacterized surface protein with fasciclin (FAS1) repeats
MKTRHLTLVLLAIAVTAASTLVSAEPTQRFKPGDQTIAEIALADGNFTTLIEALSCTGLTGAVADPSAELTVFAPNDAAFAGVGLVADNICEAFDTPTLTTILLYHVVGERRPSPSVINGKNKRIPMLAGGFIFPEGRGSLMIDANNSAGEIIAADLLASNGIIHVIDFVLLP